MAAANPSHHRSFGFFKQAAAYRRGITSLANRLSDSFHSGSGSMLANI